MTCVGPACELAHSIKGTDDKGSSCRAGSSGHMSFNIPSHLVHFAECTAFQAASWSHK